MSLLEKEVAIQIQVTLFMNFPYRLSQMPYRQYVPHTRRHMRETHRHHVLWALVVEHRHQPRLRRVERQVVPALLHRIQDVLEKVASGGQCASVPFV